MDRQCSSEDSTRRHQALPPWERQDIVQVPFLGASAPQLSSEEKHALPSLWAAQSNEASGRRGRLYPARMASSSSFGYPTSPEDTTNPWDRPVPHSATPLRTYSAPCETPTYIPPAPKTSPPPCQRSLSREPPTPPESLSNSSAHTSPTTAPTAVVTALPGTMSSRARNSSRSRTKTRRTQSDQSHATTETVGFGKRFKSAFKDMFKRNPIDESSFERIEDRHWTDEY